MEQANTGCCPALDMGNTPVAGGVGFEDLGEPGPEDGQVPEAALAFGRIDGSQENRG